MYKIFVDGELFCDARSNELCLIDPVVTLEANKAGSMTFTIPTTHPYRDVVNVRKSLIDVYIDDEEEPLFEGVASTVNEDIYGQRKVVVEGELVFLNETVLRPAHRQGYTSRQLLSAYINEHNENAGDYKQFSVGIVTARNTNDYITCFTNYNSTMQEIKEDLVDDIGGYLRVRHPDGVRTIDYLAESPRTSVQIIKLGENLLNYSSNLDTTSLCTAVIPLGARLDTQTVSGLDDYVNIKSVNDGKDYVKSNEAVGTYGYIEKVVKWDDVNTPAILKSKAESYLASEQFSNISITVNAIDLHYDNEEVPRFQLLDKIRVLSSRHGMDKYFVLTKQEIHLAKPEADKFTLGTTVTASMSTQSAELNNTIENKTTALGSAITNATQLITGAKGGYVLTKMNDQGQPSEILVMDTNSEETATKIWRWNQNGFGYSDDGGETYGTAITMDGAIVGDYIHGGVIDGVQIQSRGSVTRRAEEYTQADYDRAYNLMMNLDEPTEADYEKYDINDDGVVDLFDLIRIYNMLQGRQEEYSVDTSVYIAPYNKKGVIQTANVTIGANYVRAKNVIVTGKLRMNSGANHRLEIYDPEYVVTVEGQTVTGGYRNALYGDYVIGDKKVRFIEGIAVSIKNA